MIDIDDDVFAFLSQADTYGVADVEVVETHTAAVFLAGTRAYKLKKPVRYSYLDYSTPSLRRASCETELAVNRRFAPTLYLGVQPVARSADGKLTIGGKGTPVDWLVVMRRFDEDHQFDRMAERGALTPQLMRSLADCVAEVHEIAPISREFGGAARLRRAVDITIENLRIAAQAILPRDAVERWTSAALEELCRQSALLDRRRLDGHVRACHGDLHLRNICLFDNRPTLFDAIEFDPALSTADVLYDLAFLLMDLAHRHLGFFANQVFNRYLDRSDETDGLAALPLFMSTRAAIRAQVTAAAIAHQHGDTSTEKLGELAREYLDLAIELQRPMPPRLIAVGGFSGSGKSTLAYGLAATLGNAPGARVLRTDVLRKRLVGAPLEMPLSAAAYSPFMHDKTYGCLRDEARTCLDAGLSVIADAVFGGELERNSIEAVAGEMGIPFIGMWLDAPPEILMQRVADRAGDASDATPRVVLSQISSTTPPDRWAHVEATDTLEHTLEAANLVLRASYQASARMT